MHIALAVVCLALLGASLVAKFVLHLDFQSKDESLGSTSETGDFPGCYDNWGAHRACPQGLPSKAAGDDDDGDPNRADRS
jgi:hypothetical protein